MAENPEWQISNRGPCECGDIIVERRTEIVDNGETIPVLEERCTACKYRALIALMEVQP